MYIGCHCSMKAPLYLVGSIQEALSYNANALMVYTGPPQNSKRVDTSLLKIEQAKQLLKENNISIDNLVIHAPYIINLANCVNENTYELAKSFLKQEIQRVDDIGAKWLVLHPGSFTTATLQQGIERIITGLNDVIRENQNVTICLETMAGKGSEVGTSFEQLKQIIDGVKLKDKIGVCLDTCHIHDAGYDLNDFDTILDKFDDIISLNYLKVIHVNDSKNVCGSHKDRHENIGYGYIGFDNLYKVVTNKRIAGLPMILETPYINDKAPYKKEIESLRSGIFDNSLKEGVL